MLMNHAQAVQQYGSDYRLKQAVGRGEIYKIERGIYSSAPQVNPFTLLMYKYPGAVLTMNTAFFIHGLTDVIPQSVYVATGRGATRIRDPRIVQVFSEERLLTAGKVSGRFDGADIWLYNLERMLVEAMRNASALPPDYYREIIGSYRRRADELDIRLVEEYMGLFERNAFMQDILQREVL